MITRENTYQCPNCDRAVANPGKNCPHCGVPLLDKEFFDSLLVHASGIEADVINQCRAHSDAPTNLAVTAYEAGMKEAEGTEKYSSYDTKKVTEVINGRLETRTEYCDFHK